MDELLSNPTAASVAALVVTLGWVGYLAARTISRVNEGESLHSDWPDDLTEIIHDDYGRHAMRPDRPGWWSVITNSHQAYVGRHRVPAVDVSGFIQASRSMP